MNEQPVLRPIEPKDDAAMASVIRAVMPEFGASGPGFALHDAEVDGMYAAYRGPGRAYFVIEMGGRVLGGGGIAPLSGGEASVCELRKMYFMPELRGRGLGKKLLAHCLETAKQLGYKQCYLETLSGMDTAMHLYEQAGFRRVSNAIGCTGHFSCDRYYMLDL